MMAQGIVHTPETRERVRLLRASGASRDAIAEATGVGGSCQRNWERQRGEKPKPRLGGGIRSVTKMLPASARIHLRLAADDNAALYQRRRGDCAGLVGCEDAWIEVNGSEQAACPVGCAAYAERSERAC